MRIYNRRIGAIAWQYDTEENFWKWVKEAKFTLGFDTKERLFGLEINVFSDFGLEKTFFIHKGDWLVFELNKFAVYNDKTFTKLFTETHKKEG